MNAGFIFPGQGSQSIGMLSELADAYAIVVKTFAQASDVLGYDLWKLVSLGSDEDLNSTERTQPALLAASVSVWRVLQTKEAHDLAPSVLAGHSLGEYTALVCANALDFTDAISLVADRGRYMQEAVPAGEGAMAAILGLNDDVVATICESVSEGEIVSCANYNSPGQTVIAGQHSAVQRAIDELKAAGAKRALMLAVSVPSHCALMKPAAEALRNRLESININTPTIPVVHNVDAKMRTESSEIRQALIDQLFQPVQWVNVMKTVAENSDRVIECGPGKILTGLSKRIDRKLDCYPVFDPTSLEKVFA